MFKVLEVQPDQLTFDVNEDSKSATKCLSLSNSDSNLYIIFKIRTSGKNRYIVKPNSGIITANSKIQIQVSCNVSPGDETSKSLLDKFVIYWAHSQNQISGKEEIDEFIKQNRSKCTKLSLNSNVNFPRRLANLQQSMELESKNPSRNIGGSTNENQSLSKTKILEETFSASKEIVNGFSQNDSADKKPTMSSFHRRKTGEENGLNHLKGTTKFEFGKKANLVSPQISQMEIRVRKDVFLTKSHKTISVDFSTVKEESSVFYNLKKTGNNKYQDDQFKHLKRGSFPGWQLLMSAIVGVIIGAYLNGN